MPEQLADRARKAAEEIAWVGGCGVPKESFIKMLSDIVERHMREWREEEKKDMERAIQFNESEIRRFEENHKEATPCPKK